MCDGLIKTPEEFKAKEDQYFVLVCMNGLYDPRISLPNQYDIFFDISNGYKIDIKDVRDKKEPQKRFF